MENGRSNDGAANVPPSAGQERQPAGQHSGSTPGGGTPPLPVISLPKGGGAIRGIGEKFGANPATGTGTMTVPIAASPGRSGFGPQLALAYDSGNGNGPFGIGWSLGLPAITRATDKGLPRYLDADESDAFILSGAENLVPVIAADGQRLHRSVTLHGAEYDVTTYRPRIEGLFARIERWTAVASGISHWRSITRDNVTTLYGIDASRRIADPADDRRIFSWLIAQTFDDKGNLVVYTYAQENGTGVDRGRVHESNRDLSAPHAQRYVKRISYAATAPWFPDWAATGDQTPLPTDWHFEIVFDYGDHSLLNPTPTPDQPWPVRPDPFSSYLSGFEVRTYRRCQRVLSFHHFPAEQDVGTNCLVRSTDLHYSDEDAPLDPRNPVYSFITSVEQAGYRRTGSGYLRRTTPPLEFEYSSPRIQPDVLTLDPDSAANVPEGLGGTRTQLVDLDGEGLPGILIEQDGGWSYKRNLSPLREHGADEISPAMFGPLEPVAVLPSPAHRAGSTQFLDLAGDGRLDAVMFEDPTPGFYERTTHASWEPLRAFESLPRLDWSDPNLKFIDLTGDGHADLLLTQDDLFTVYPSLAERGFGAAEQIPMAWDEKLGPRVVFADGTQTIHLADMSGDGLSDIVRIRNGDTCYWPNLGYGRFGPRITMDTPHRFVDDERYDPRRVRLADIDGSGTTDLIYIAESGVYVCFNRSGNAWAEPYLLAVFPGADDLSTVQVADLLGNGTACLIWSSPLPGVAHAPLRYIDLMGGRKPHLMVTSRNNLGAETRLRYAPSTRSFLADERAGRPWITRLPFPVHLVEQVEIYDWIGRSRFVTRYAYHHGYFDGNEREFRGFGMVEQWDTEEHRGDTAFPEAEPSNWDAASWTPPVLTRTWFHTGAFDEAPAVSRQYASEYWTEPVLRPEARSGDREAMLLPDTVLPPGLTPDETREAYRALKGMSLRTEVYAEDGSSSADHPYSVTEQNFTVKVLQEKGDNRHAVFFVHPREVVSFDYERDPDDPRVSHDVTLETDAYGNVLRSVSIGYPRRAGYPDPEPALDQAFRDMLGHDQTRIDVTATLHRVTNAIDDLVAYPNTYRTPLSSESMVAELTGMTPAGNRPGITNLFRFKDLDDSWALAWDGTHDAKYEDVSASDINATPETAPGTPVRRIVEHRRTRYRRDDLTDLLPFDELQPLALTGESYQLALTPSLISRIFDTRVTDAMLDEGGYVQLPGSTGWWIPSGRVFLSPGDGDTPVQERAEARAHFSLTRRAIDPFGGITRGSYAYDMLATTATDAVGNTVVADHDFRVLQPFRVTDPNGNRVEAAFDALGLVVANAARGKATENLGDELSGFDPDLDDAGMLAHLGDPLADPESLIGNATSRLVHDLFAYYRTRDQDQPAPPVVHTVTRERHINGADPAQPTPPARFQHGFAYADGFGREIQRKAQAEAGSVPGISGNVSPRWVGSGWTIFNNKGQPVRTFEPFFSATQRFEFAHATGVSTVLFYDPTGRVVATLHPDNTWEKVVFDTWRQETWDVNDTVSITDPRTDADVGAWFQRFLGDAPNAFTSWHDARIGNDLGTTAAQRVAERDAAEKTVLHAGTTTVMHFDARGRTCLTVTNNGAAGRYPTRVALDTEDKPLAVIDNRGRRVIEYCRREADPAGGIRYVAGYDLAGTVLYRNGMDSGERRMLVNIASNPIRAWDARDQVFRMRYDALQRPTHRYVSANGGAETLLERTVYGDAMPEWNLRGKLWRQYDAAGLASSDRYDFKGNLLESTRHLAREYRRSIDWSALADLSDRTDLDAAAAPLLAATDQFATSTIYDALSRPVQSVTPHTGSMQPSVIRLTYNDASLPDRLDVWLRQSAAPAALLDPATADRRVVTDVTYNARGQRTRVALGNGTVTRTEHDRVTFRIASMRTTRPGSIAANQRVVQDLSYTYDPAGNITRIRDEADIQNVVYFRNQRVDPTADYTYDPLYRLARATGREHLGQTGGALNPPSRVTNDDTPRLRIPHRGDGNAMATYVETYAYDPTGNLLEMIHQVSSGAWTRAYTYAEPSRIDPAQHGNRLSTTGEPGQPPDPAYTADAHGNMTRMPHLPSLGWDEQDRLRSTTRQVVNAGTPETTYYVYDAGGQRLRKVTDKAAAQGAAPVRRTERLYLGPFEIHREFNGNGTTITLQRETLHVLFGSDRVAMIETRTQGTDGGSAQLDRYQFGNHLGSATLELDGSARIISYEEYFPFGSTAYQAVRNQAETPKRYRYTGKERDEESDLFYNGARYYAPWLGRWTACDPSGTVDGLNLYAYVRNNPIVIHDPSGRSGKKPTANYGDMKPHGSQGGAIWEGTKRLSEHEHIRARINLYLQTMDPLTGHSPYDKAAYGKSMTLTIPKDMANAKTKMDLALRDKLKDALKKGVVSEDLIKEMDIEADINRTIAARDQAIKARQAAGKSIDDLKSISNTQITETAHLQQSELFHVGKSQKSPIAGASADEIDKAVDVLDDKASDAAKPAAKAETAAAKTEKAVVKAETAAVKTETKALKVGGEGLEVATKQGGKTILKKLGTKALKVIPFVGIGAGVTSMGVEASQGNYGTATLDAVGLIPVVGDVVDAARLGVAVGEVANEALGIDKVAAEHGEAVEGAAKSLGLSQDTSRIIGAGGAAISAITIAPTIAVTRTISGWFK